jgi:hypothetical protein
MPRILNSETARIRQLQKLWELQHLIRRRGSASHYALSLGAGPKALAVAVAVSVPFCLSNPRHPRHTLFPMQLPLQFAAAICGSTALPRL